MTDTKTCPYCSEEIKARAIKCRYCHSNLDDNSTQPVFEIQPPKETATEKLEKTGKTLQAVGCVLTLLVTIPILLLLVLGGC